MNNFYGKLTINNVNYIDNKMDEWEISGSIYEPSGMLWIDVVNVGDNIYVDNLMFYGYLGKYKIISISDEFSSWDNFKAIVKWDMPNNSQIDPMAFSDAVISSSTSLGIPLEPEPVSLLLAPTFLTAILNYEKYLVDGLIQNNSGSTGGTNDYNDLINKPIFINNISIENNQLIVNKSDGTINKLPLPTSGESGGTSEIISSIVLDSNCNSIDTFELIKSINDFDFIWVNISSIKNGQKLFSQPMYLNVSSIQFNENEQFKYRADLGAYLTFTFSNPNTLKITDINLVNFDSMQIDKILGIKFKAVASPSSILSFEKGLSRSLSNLNLTIPYTTNFDFNKIHIDKLISNSLYNINLNLNISNKEFSHTLINNDVNLFKKEKYINNIIIVNDDDNGFIGKFKLNSNQNKKIIIK